MTGPIDENANFPEVKADGSPLNLDFSGVKHINSIGIKMWIQWVTPVAQGRQVTFVNCPKSIILQINMVKSFLPEGASVESFKLPLYCEACDSESNIMLQTKSDVQVDGENVKVTSSLPKCSNCGSDDVEIDVIEKKYFRFLSGA